MANINGTENPEVLQGTEEDDLMTGRQGDDTLRGDEGDDNMRGNLGDDDLSGGNGDDMLNGGAGNDEIRGGKGADILEGGSGADTFEFFFGADFRSETDDDIVLDFELGVDSAYFKAPSSYTFDVTTVGEDLVIEVSTTNGMDRGSITFNGLGGLSKDLTDVSVEMLDSLLNATYYCEEYYIY